MEKIKLQAQNLTDAVKPVARHSTFILIVVLLGFLIYSVYTVSAIIGQASDSNYRSQQESSTAKTKFDQATIDRIKNLQTSSQSNTDITFSVNRERQNPFTELSY